MRWFWFDGFFANACDSIILTYLPLFLLTLGATSGQIGLMNALSSFCAALILLPSAALVEHLGHRKQIALLAGGGAGRTALLLLALVPLVLPDPIAVYAVIALVIARGILGNMGFPAWISLTADIVPLSWRGRYFSSRNIAMGLAGLATTLMVGQLIHRMGDSPVGYQVAMSLAFVIGMMSTLCFSRIQEPAPSIAPRERDSRDWRTLLRHLLAHPEFLAFCAVSALWNFSLHIAAPFFSPYQVQVLGATPDVVGFLSIVAPLSALPAQRLFGKLADRWGPRRVQYLTGFLIPLLPWAWVLTRSPWHAAPINLAGGFLWAGYNLASFNMLLVLTPEDLRPRYTALYQIVVTLAVSGGAALGSAIFELVNTAYAETWAYRVNFVTSGIGRLAAALLFVLLNRRVAASRPSATSTPCLLIPSPESDEGQGDIGSAELKEAGSNTPGTAPSEPSLQADGNERRFSPA
jgi:MFS family permease